jgi:hypothetical protein
MQKRIAEIFRRKLLALLYSAAEIYAVLSRGIHLTTLQTRK